MIRFSHTTHFSHIRYTMQRFFLRWQSGGSVSAALSVLCLTILFLLPLSMNTARIEQEKQAAALAPHILRFHILANSDSAEDQALKLEVRDLLLTQISNGIDETSSKEALQSYIADHAEELETSAEEYMKSHGFSYSARVELTQCYFPARQYNNMLIPGGTYDAVRILLGEAKGHNWWCVLYPPLAFSGSGSVEEIPENSADDAAPSTEELSKGSVKGVPSLIPAEDYGWAADRPKAENTVTVHIRLKVLEMLKKKTSP